MMKSHTELLQSLERSMPLADAELFCSRFARRFFFASLSAGSSRSLGSSSVSGRSYLRYKRSLALADAEWFCSRFARRL